MLRKQVRTTHRLLASSVQKQLKRPTISPAQQNFNFGFTKTWLSGTQTRQISFNLNFLKNKKDTVSSSQEITPAKYEPLDLLRRANNIIPSYSDEQIGLFFLSSESGEVDNTSAPVPLTAMKLDAKIKGNHARCIFTQDYFNTENNAVEAVFTFPLWESSVITSFKAQIDDRVLVAKVEDKDAAREEYEEALEQGHTAAMMNETKPDVFSLRLGRLPPNKKISLVIDFTMQLQFVDDTHVRFVFPTSMTPRYVPKSEKDRTNVFKNINPTFSEKVPYGLQMKIDVEMDSPIKKITSPSHHHVVSNPVKESNGDKEEAAGAPLLLSHATITVQNQAPDLDRDFVVDIELHSRKESVAYIEVVPPADKKTSPDEVELAAMLSFSPKILSLDEHSKELPCEIIFLVDKSGSMAGSAIKQTQAALRSFLKYLPPSCMFNIVSFTNDFEKLFPHSLSYEKYCSDKSIRSKTEIFIDQLDNEMGGTELLEPLHDVLASKEIPGFARQIIVLTDGSISNTDEVIQEISKHESRVFTIGLGYGVSSFLVKSMAQAGKGSAEFVVPGENVERRVLKQLTRAIYPALLQDVKVSWLDDALPLAFQSPEAISSISMGDSLTAYAHIKCRKDQLNQLLQKPILVTGLYKGNQTQFEVPVQLLSSSTSESNSDSFSIIPLVFKSRIRDLEFSDGVEPKIAELAKRFNLSSSMTSYLLVDHATKYQSGPVKTRNVPLQTIARRTSSAKLQSVLLLDVTPRNIGIISLKDPASGMMETIIHRNTAIPKVHTYQVTLSKDQMKQSLFTADGTTWFQVMIAQGEFERNNITTKAKISIPVNTPEGIQLDSFEEFFLEITFDIDTNGVLKVIITERNSGFKHEQIVKEVTM